MFKIGDRAVHHYVDAWLGETTATGVITFLTETTAVLELDDKEFQVVYVKNLRPVETVQAS